MKKSYLLLLFLVITVISCDPFHAILHEDDVDYYTASNLVPGEMPDTFKVMTWNIKFGGGRIDFFFDCYGDRVIMTKSEVIDNMEGLASKINQYNPDILFMQEVDMDSKRSAMVNQVQWILDNTALNYAVYASQWKADFVPSNGIGRINSGNCIASKWELSKAVRIGLPLMEEQSAIVRYFYLKRNILHAKMTYGNKDINLITTHLSAYSHDGTKKKQVDILYNLIDSLDRTHEQFILGGDFNCLPPGSEKLNNFPDAVCEAEKFSADDFTEETDWLVPFYKFNAAIPLDIYQKDNTPYFSHTTKSPANGGFWSRKLDYIFTNGNLVKGSGMVHQDKSSGGMNTMDLSDHAPVTVKYVVK